jgi:hypothetical protein
VPTFINHYPLPFIYIPLPRGVVGDPPFTFTTLPSRLPSPELCWAYLLPVVWQTRDEKHLSQAMSHPEKRAHT